MSSTIAVKVARYDPEKDKDVRYETYSVPYHEKMRVLDVLHYIQENFDGTLAFRANCRAGRCGSDAMEIDGKPALACKQEIEEGTKEIVINPLRAFPLIKDLVVDISGAYDKGIIVPVFAPEGEEKDFWRIRQEEIEETKELKKCIECFICHDVCHVIRDHKADYIGPRFVVKAAALDKHPRDTRKRSELLKEKGLWLCNISRCCQESCPENIRITDDAIIHEKESSMDGFISLEKLARILRGAKK